jgi:hypothetical protein
VRRAIALAEARGFPLGCTIQAMGQIGTGVPGWISYALAQGASAADVARMMQAEGKIANPDTAVWVKAPEIPGGSVWASTCRAAATTLL